MLLLFLGERPFPGAMEGGIHFALPNTSIPPLPSKFVSAAAVGEFIELLHYIDLGSGEEPPLRVHLADDHQLSLSRRPRKRNISAFEEWVACFIVYANTFCALHGLICSATSLLPPGV